MTTKQKKLDKADQATVAADRSPSKIQDLIRYFEESKVELGKVSWATRKEVKATSIAVLLLVIVMSIFLGLADLILSKIMEAILS
jgi:preprotein translocase subunit SecE